MGKKTINIDYNMKKNQFPFKDHNFGLQYKNKIKMHNLTTKFSDHLEIYNILGLKSYPN